MLLELGKFRYAVLPGSKPREWKWAVYGFGEEDPILQGQFRGSEGQAHMAAREEIARLRESRGTRSMWAASASPPA